MDSRLRLLAAVVATFAGSMAVAAEPDPAPAVPQPITVTGNKEDPKEPDQIVCRREADTGSRIKSTKVCMSRRQWAEQGREAARHINSMPSASGVTQ